MEAMDSKQITQAQQDTEKGSESESWFKRHPRWWIGLIIGVVALIVGIVLMAVYLPKNKTNSTTNDVQHEKFTYMYENEKKPSKVVTNKQQKTQQSIEDQFLKSYIENSI